MHALRCPKVPRCTFSSMNYQSELLCWEKAFMEVPLESYSNFLWHMVLLESWSWMRKPSTLSPRMKSQKAHCPRWFLFWFCVSFVLSLVSSLLSSPLVLFMVYTTWFILELRWLNGWTVWVIRLASSSLFSKEVGWTYLLYSQRGLWLFYHEVSPLNIMWNLIWPHLGQPNPPPGALLILRYPVLYWMPLLVNHPDQIKFIMHWDKSASNPLPWMMFVWSLTGKVTKPLIVNR